MAFQHSSTTMMRWRSLAATTWASHAPAQTRMAEKAGLWSTADRSMTMPGPDQSTVVVDCSVEHAGQVALDQAVQPPGHRLGVRGQTRQRSVFSSAAMAIGRSHQQVHHVAQRRCHSATSSLELHEGRGHHRALVARDRTPDRRLGQGHHHADAPAPDVIGPARRRGPDRHRGD